MVVIDVIFLASSTSEGRPSFSSRKEEENSRPFSLWSPFLPGHHGRLISRRHLLCRASRPAMDRQLAHRGGSRREDDPSHPRSQSEEEAPHCSSGAHRRALWFGLFALHPTFAGSFSAAQLKWKLSSINGNYWLGSLQEYGHRYKYGCADKCRPRSVSRRSIWPRTTASALSLILFIT